MMVRTGSAITDKRRRYKILYSLLLLLLLLVNHCIAVLLL